MELPNSDNPEIDPSQRGRLDRLRGALRKYWHGIGSPLVKDGDATGAGYIDVLSERGTKQVVVEEARHEAELLRTFLSTVDSNRIPVDSLPPNLSPFDPRVRQIFEKWLARNEPVVALRRREVELLAKNERRLHPDQLWLFIQRGHALRDSLTKSLETLCTFLLVVEGNDRRSSTLLARE